MYPVIFVLLLLSACASMEPHCRGPVVAINPPRAAVAAARPQAGTSTPSSPPQAASPIPAESP